MAPVVDDDATERKIVRGFVTWHHLRRLRRGFPQRRTTFEQSVVVRRETRIAVHLLACLQERGRSLDNCDQSDIDQWLAGGTSYHYGARNFVVWCVQRGHANVRHGSGADGGVHEPCAGGFLIDVSTCTMIVTLSYSTL